MIVRTAVVTVLVLLSCPLGALGQEDLSLLLQRLDEVDYPLEHDDLVGLGESQDPEKRIHTLQKILGDRRALHSREDLTPYVKTEITCSALRLLDGYDLPRVDGIIRRLSGEEDWEVREKAILAFLAAKRDMGYRENVAYLLRLLPKYTEELSRGANDDVAWTITDLCTCLSSLAELYLLRGDDAVLSALFTHSTTSLGYPAEYASYILVDLLLKRPKPFIASLARCAGLTRASVLNSITYGIRSDRVKKQIEEVLNDGGTRGDREKDLISALAGRLADR